MKAYRQKIFDKSCYDLGKVNKLRGKKHRKRMIVIFFKPHYNLNYARKKA